MEKLTKEQALAKIDELKKYVECDDVEKEEKVVGLEIKSIWGGVKFKSTKTTIKEAVIEAVGTGADLTDADLRGADLTDADLTDADLTGANLTGANLRDADLTGANLRDADLTDADLTDAELHNAKFYGRGGNRVLKKSQLESFLGALGFIIEE